MSLTQSSNLTIKYDSSFSRIAPPATSAPGLISSVTLGNGTDDFQATDLLILNDTVAANTTVNLDISTIASPFGVVLAPHSIKMLVFQNLSASNSDAHLMIGPAVMNGFVGPWVDETGFNIAYVNSLSLFYLNPKDGYLTWSTSPWGSSGGSDANEIAISNLSLTDQGHYALYLVTV